MDVTFGDAEAITEGTVQEILEQSRAAARRIIEAQLETERRLREAAEVTARHAQEEMSAEMKAQRERFQEFAVVIGAWFRRLMMAGGLAFFVIAAYFTWPTNQSSQTNQNAAAPAISPTWPRLILSFLPAFVLLGSATFGICNVV